MSPIGIYIHTSLKRHALLSLHIIQLRNLIQQLHRLRRTRDPSRGTRKPGFEIVGAGAEELVADVEGAAAFDAAEVRLAGHDAPAFVADVDEDVVAA